MANFKGGMKPNDGMNTNKVYGKPQNVLDGQSLIQAADTNQTGWSTGTVKRPYLDTSKVKTGSIL